ncbi:MAG: oligosaccharide flippase family protein [Anaerolineae bacterium]|nr:oligosaccharide flippase family protein [Anaerolineae bacterium]
MGDFARMLFGLLSTTIAARFLAEEVFGAFVVLNVVAVFLAESSNLGLGSSIVKFVTSTKDERRIESLINSTLSFQLMIIIVVSVLTFFIREPLSNLFKAGVVLDSFIFLPMMYAMESLYRTLRPALESLFLFKNTAIAESISSISNALFTILFVIVFDMDMEGLVYAKIISLGLAAGFAYLSLPIKKKLQLQFAPLKEMLIFGFPLQLNQMLTFFYQRLDTIMIGLLLGPAQIAYYEIARRIPDSLSSAYQSFRSVYFPVMASAFARDEYDEASKIINAATRLISFVMILGALIAALFGHELITLLFSDRYSSSVLPFILLMIGLAITMVNYTLGNALVAVGESNKPVIVNTTHTVIGLAANWLFIPIFGTVGAALATLAGLFGKNPLNVIFLRRKNVDVKPLEYLQTFFLFGLFVIPLIVFGKIPFAIRVLIVPLFIAAAVALPIVKRKDLDAFITQSRQLLTRWTSRMHSS